MPIVRLTREQAEKDIRRNDPLADFFVWWDDITRADIDKLEKTLDSAKTESQLQRLLEDIPLLLVQHLRGGHGRWVIPQKRLGAEFVTDFIIGEKHSFGYDWCAVELESPHARMFTRNGDPTKELKHAIRQIQDWRIWLRSNRDYAIRSKSENGLGLTGIDSDISGLILEPVEK